MEDCDSVKSNESAATSDEFDFVSDKPGPVKAPTLNIVSGSNINDLTHFLSEAMQETEGSNEDMGLEEPKKVGHSLFYTSPVIPGTDPLSRDLPESTNVSPTEKQDDMKPEFSDEEGKKNILYIIRISSSSLVCRDTFLPYRITADRNVVTVFIAICYNVTLFADSICIILHIFNG